MKNYLNLEGLAHFFDKLIEKFSTIGHTHTRSEIEDLKELVVTDDGDGNVTIECSYTAEGNLSDLQSRMSTVENTLSSNGYLVVSDE